jgi:hypothetical protein
MLAGLPHQETILLLRPLLMLAWFLWIPPRATGELRCRHSRPPGSQSLRLKQRLSSPRMGSPCTRRIYVSLSRIEMQ